MRIVCSLSIGIYSADCIVGLQMKPSLTEGSQKRENTDGSSNCHLC